MASTVIALSALFIGWFFATMYLMFRGFRLYHEHLVPMYPERLRPHWPWWNWKYMTKAFVLRAALIALLHLAITAACLFMAWLAI